MNAKQKLFCDEYLIDLNPVQAALRAGYSKTTAAKASAWIDDDSNSQDKSIHKPELVKYIADRMASKQSALIASQDEVLEYLTRVMRRQENEHTVQVVGEYVPVTAQNKSGGEYTSIKRQERTKVVDIPTPVKDANKAAELLGKRYAIFTENVAVDLNQMPTIISKGDGSVEIGEP